jgi:hypothetical protein
MKACDAISLRFPTATPSEVSDMARQIGGTYLASLSSLLRTADGHAVACDGGDDGTGIKHFDVRVRVLVDGIIANLHVCVLPETVSATGESMFEMLDSVMFALDPNWHTRVVGISMDGASAMTGWCACLSSRVVEAASSTCYRVWCMAHQFSLVVKAAGADMAKPPLQSATEVPGLDFVGYISTLAGILRRQSGLVKKMGMNCPRFLDVRWTSLFNVVNWLKRKIRHQAVVAFLESRNMSYEGGVSEGAVVWKQVWLLVCSLDTVFSRLDKAFTILQGFSLTIPEVQSEYEKVCMDIKVPVGVVALQEGEMAPVGAVYLGYYYVTRASMQQFLEKEMLSFTIIDSLESID